MRGSRTQGYGRIGQHRDAGSKGHRKVGRHKHLWSLVSNEKQPYFGKQGFTSPQSLKRQEKTLNLARLDELARQNPAETTINLTSMGYTKLLGTGKITKPLTITVRSTSKTAAEKIAAAGGKILTAQTAEAEAEQSGE
jgi:large subunit ribosomal protein L15